MKLKRQRRILRPYQKDALSYCNKTDTPALFMEMRLGKTLVTIRSIKYKNAKLVLIVCPFSAFKGWRDELYNENENQPIEITGTLEKRVQALYQAKTTDDRQWFLFNKEGNRCIDSIHWVQWDALILDESTFIKNPKPAVTKYYCKMFRDVEYKYILTGLPAPESELDYFQQLYFLDPLILDYRNYWEFRFQNFECKVKHKWEIKPASRVELKEKLQENCFFLNRKDVNLGGQKIHQTREVKFYPKIHKIYKTMLNEFLVEYKNEVIKKTKFAPVRFSYMHQLCGGFINDDFVFNAKLKELKYLLDTELKGQQVIIWADYTNEIQKIYSSLENVRLIYGDIPKVTRDKVQEDFQNGNIQYLIANPSCFKYGVDLSAASTVIYYSCPMSSETRQQSEDRVINVSKNDSVLILDLVVKDSIDEDIKQSMLLKETRSKMFERMIKNAQRN